MKSQTRWNNRWIAVGAILILATTTLSAQLFAPKSSLERQFDRAVDEYENQQYESALQQFQDLYENHRGFPLTTATHLMLVKTYYYLGLDRKSINLAKLFNAQYPNSDYLDDVYYAMAEAYYALNEYQNSTKAFAHTILHSNDETLARMALENFMKMTDVYLSLDDVQALVDGAIEPREEQLYRFALLQEYILSGEMSLASTTAMELEMSPRNQLLQPTFQALKKAISLESNKQIAIAVLVPQNGSSGSLGRDLLNGVRYALAEAADLPQVSLITLDNSGTGLRTVHQLERIANHQRVIAVIGPLYSENVVAGAAIADNAQLPLITPTATENGLAELSRYVFQLSPDYETRGNATAQFAMDSLGLKTFAVVSPADPHGKALTDAFSAEVESRGGEVLSQVWYSGTPEDITEQFQHLRQVAFEELARTHPSTVDTTSIVSDSLRATLSDSEFVELFNSRMGERAEEIDSSAIRLSAFDGFYFPVNSGDVDYIAPQFAFHNFKTQVLGNIEWYDESKLLQYSTYIDSIVICSDYYLPENDPAYQKFVSDYRKRMGITPTTLQLYGYDTMSLILDLIRDGNTTRNSVRTAMNGVDHRKGIIRDLTLDSGRPRVNQTVQMLQFIHNRLRSVGPVTTGPRRSNPIESFFSE